MRTTTIVAAAALLTLAGCASNTSDAADGGMNKQNAKSQCEQAAEERSDDPGNVKFSGQSETTFTEIDGGWDVSGWVDNPNGTGGFERFNYACQVTPAEGDQVNVKLDITAR